MYCILLFSIQSGIDCLNYNYVAAIHDASLFQAWILHHLLFRLLYIRERFAQLITALHQVRNTHLNKANRFSQIIKLSGDLYITIYIIILFDSLFRHSSLISPWFDLNSFGKTRSCDRGVFIFLYCPRILVWGGHGHHMCHIPARGSNISNIYWQG